MKIHEFSEDFFNQFLMKQATTKKCGSSSVGIRSSEQQNKVSKKDVFFLLKCINNERFHFISNNIWFLFS